MLIFIIIHCIFSQQISIQDSYQNTWTIYDGNSISSGFLWSDKQCCTPPNLTVISALSSTNYENIITFTFKNFNLLKYSYKNYGKDYYLLGSQQNSFQIKNICKYDSKILEDDINYSGMVEFKLQVQNTISLITQNLEFHYYFVCKYSETSNKYKIEFDLSMLFIVILACICVGIFTKLNKIRSIKIPLPNPMTTPALQRWIAAQPFASEEKYIYFQGFSVTWITYIFYLIATGVFYLIVVFNPDTWYNIIYIIVLVFSLFCCYFFINEIQYYFSVNYRLQNKILYFIRVCDIVSIIFSVAFVTLYIIFEQPWYLSCIIAFCISGSLARLFKIVSLRGVTILYSMIIIYDLIYYFGVLYYEKINYQIEVLQYTNYPVLFQLPQFKYNENKICVWLSVTDVIVPALSIAYLYRFGKNRNSKVYFYMGLSGLFFGIIVWAFAAFSAASHSVQISQSFIVLPILVCSASLWAIRQGDLRILWYGYFYDYYLAENFTVASNTEEIEKEYEISDKKAENLLQNLKADLL